MNSNTLNEFAIDYAASYGHLDIIQWFDQSKHELKYKNAIDYADMSCLVVLKMVSR